MSGFLQLADPVVDSAEVAWLVSKRAAAIRSRDAEYLASRYAAGVVTFGVAPPLSPHAGEAHTVGWLRDWFDRFAGRIDHRVRDLTVSVCGDVAFCHSMDVLTARPVHGRRREVRFETTLGLRREGGVWLVASERLRVTE